MSDENHPVMRNEIDPSTLPYHNGQRLDHYNRSQSEEMDFPFVTRPVVDEEQDSMEDDQDEFSLRIVNLSDPTSTPPNKTPNTVGNGIPSSPNDQSPHRNNAEYETAVVQSLRSISSDQLANSSDTDIRRRIKDFRFAQAQRRKKYSYRPYGVIGLFNNLSDTRSDLYWAEDAAWRRSKHLPYIGWSEYEENRKRDMNRCYFTYTMMVICSIALLVAFYFNHWKIEPMSTNPLVGPSPDVLMMLGALQMREMLASGTWYRLLTAVVLHGGILHLFINMVALGLLGRGVERNHGIVLTSVIFFTSALGGNIVSCLMQPGYILVGSSGGLFGLMGVCVADIVLNWKLLFLVFCNDDGSPVSWSVKVCSVIWLIVDLMANAVIGFTPFVDNFAHMGGLIYGFLISLTVLQRLPLAFFGRGNGFCFKFRMRIYRISGVLFGAVLLATTSALLSQSDGVRNPCHKCRYISCLPFPFWTSDKWWYCDGCDTVDGEVFKLDVNDKLLYTDLDLYCPGRSGAVRIDISGSAYRDVSHVEGALSEYCRRYCD